MITGTFILYLCAALRNLYICINETLLRDGGACFDAHVLQCNVKKGERLKCLFSLKCEIDCIVTGLGLLQ